MNSFPLESVSEDTRNSILPMTQNPGGSEVTLDGSVVGYFFPQSLTGQLPDEPWSDEKNHRRVDLIEKKYSFQSLTLEEHIELTRLQAELRRHVDQVAPVPLEQVRALHRQLLADVVTQASS
jgi:hypothetical protein